MLWKLSISCTRTLGQPLCFSPWPWVCCTEASRTQSRGLVDLNTNCWGRRSLLLSWKTQNQNKKNLVSLAVKVYIHRLCLWYSNNVTVWVFHQQTHKCRVQGDRESDSGQRQGDRTFPKAMLVQDPRKKELQSAKEASSLPASSYFVFTIKTILVWARDLLFHLSISLR